MIKSTDAEVRGLIEALDAGESARESAIARLNIIGSRGTNRLIAAFDSAGGRDRQLAILRVLETCGDERALPVARRALAAGGELAVGAVAVLRELLARGSGVAHTEALDILLSVSTEPAAERRVRAAAAQALDTASDDVRDAIGGRLQAVGSVEDVLWEEAVEGRFPDDPGPLRDAIDARAPRAPLQVLRRVIEAVRAQEDGAASAARRNAWRTVRGAVHEALAARGSRIALYDLREAIEATAEPLPVSFLTAVQAVGDGSCLEPLATAFSRARGLDAGWRQQLARTFHALAARERLTKRHSAVRRALAKAPQLAGL